MGFDVLLQDISSFTIGLDLGAGWVGFRSIDLGNLRLWLGVVMPEVVLRDRTKIPGIPSP